MSDISKEAAESLWSDLREAFSNAEAKIIEIIKTRAWEPLGYATFADAWNERMQGFRLTTDALKAHVVYALMADGQTDSEILATVSGLGDRAMAGLRSQRDAGVSAEAASTYVRPHMRALPGEPERLHVTLTHGEVTYYRDLCNALGLDRDDEAAKAIRSHFRKLEGARRGAE